MTDNQRKSLHQLLDRMIDEEMVIGWIDEISLPLNEHVRIELRLWQDRRSIINKDSP